jgi:hypothetical protein
LERTVQARHLTAAVIGFGFTVLLSGCPGALPPLPPDVAGLKADDFELISLNGFDPEDNSVDINDYAWSMQHFEPDGDAAAQLLGRPNGAVYTARIRF